MDFHSSVVPYEVHWSRHYCDRNPEEDESQRYREVQQERNQPAIVVAVKDQTNDPPAIHSQVSTENWERRYVRGEN